MAGGIDGEVFTFELAEPARVRASRLADAALLVDQRAQSARMLFLVIGIGFLVLGVLSFGDNPLYGAGMVAFSLWYIEHCGLRSGARRRLVALYLRDPIMLAPGTVRLEETGIEITTRWWRSWSAWGRFEAVRPFEGGLLVIGRGRRVMHDLPPSAFSTGDERDRAQRAITRWIIDASTTAEPPTS